MFCEPSRTALNSADIQWRIIWQRIAMNFSYQMIRRNLNVGIWNSSRSVKVFSQTGDVRTKVVSAQQSSQKAQ